MDRVGIKGAFFLPSRCPEYPYDAKAWRAVAANGHEIGSHSVTHTKAAELTDTGALWEAWQSRKSLEATLGTHVTSFCYPYTDAPKHLQDPVKKYYLQARGGRGARADKNIVPGDGVNLFNVPSYHISWKSFLNEPGAEEDYLYARIEEAVERGAWIVLMFHGVGQEGTWDNVGVPQFQGLLSTLLAYSRLGEVWTAPFGTVANYLRGKL
jgi:peptidoglycan/xylan/chitin deacetylase (PgdA/CDA1 family)